jgi:hypothetical protein
MICSICVKITDNLWIYDCRYIDKSTGKQHLIATREMQAGANEIWHGDAKRFLVRLQLPQSDVVFAARCKYLGIIAAI